MAPEPETRARATRTPPGGRFRGLFLRRIPLRLDEQTTMILIAVVIGIFGGLGAYFFRWLIGSIENLSWGAEGTSLERFARSPWYWRMAVPAAGGLLVGLIVKFLAPEAKGHGVPEVMNAVARNGGVIRPIVAVAKSFASAISIGTGGSVGREGPIVQIGSALGSTLGRILRLSTRRIRTCVGCGAAAGIAATFNAPIAGAFFAGEVILGGFAFGAFGSVVISSVTATVIARSLLGDVPAFVIPAYSIVSPAEMLTYAALGLLAGAGAVVFVQVLFWFEELSDRLRTIPGFIQPVIGGALIGAFGLLFPEVMGVGYDTITDALTAKLGLAMMVILLFAKIFATSLTLGSGGSGGVFAPSLFMGAALGGAVGRIAQQILPWSMASPGAYAVVGMGAMVAATTHAPITAILIIFEMTGDYRVILGLMISCILGTLVAQRIRRESIYTIKLSRRGIDLHAGQEVNVLRSLRVRDIARREVETVPRHASVEDLYRRMVDSRHYEFFVVDANEDLQGVVSVDDLRHLLPHLENLKRITIAEDIMTRPVLFVREEDTLDYAMHQLGKGNFEELPVLPSGTSMRPIGTIQRHDVIKAYNKEITRVDLPGSMSASLHSASRMRMWETVGGYVLAQVEAPPHLCGRPLESLRLRQEHGVQVILIERSAESGDSRFTLPRRDTILTPGDRVILFGQRDSLRALLQETDR
ncbi:MAG: CBS domain-containing protein [Candidatus Eisenbacteria bacterium]|nr:CBS domain-containing protein [Candidatus Latescibacterota bacterium]MBD3302553.1 CBS domain-containing protein [Candidatus Eisenbacteria bacterium]